MHHTDTHTHTLTQIHPQLCIISVTSSHLFTPNLHLQLNSLTLVAQPQRQAHFLKPSSLLFFPLLLLLNCRSLFLIMSNTQLLPLSSISVFDWVSNRTVTYSILDWIRIPENAFDLVCVGVTSVCMENTKMFANQPDLRCYIIVLLLNVQIMFWGVFISLIQQQIYQIVSLSVSTL